MGGFTEWLPTAPKRKDAGKYTVYYVEFDPDAEDDKDTDENEKISGVKLVKAEILRRAVSVTSGFTCSGKIYDGYTDAEVKCDDPVFSTGKIEKDLLTVSAEGTYEKKDAGTWNVTISNIRLGGESAKNYTLAMDGTQKKIPEVVIAQKPLKIIAKNKTISVGQTAPDLSDSKAGEDYTVSGLVQADKDMKIEVTLTYEDEPDIFNVGTCTIKPTVIKEGYPNYSVKEIPGELKIVDASFTDLYFYEGTVRNREKVVKLSTDGKDVKVDLSVEGKNLTQYSVNEALDIDTDSQTDADKCAEGVAFSASADGTLFTVPLTISKTKSGQTEFEVTVPDNKVILKVVTDDVNVDRHGKVKITPDAKTIGTKLTAEYVPNANDSIGQDLKKDLKWKWSRYTKIEDKGTYDILAEGIGEKEDYTLTKEDVGKDNYVAVEAWVDGAECGSAKSEYFGPITDPSSEPEPEPETETETETETEENPVVVTEVTITGPDEVEMEMGKTLQLKAETKPAEKPVKWSTTDKAVATVSDTGLVTAVSKGSAFITAANGSASDAVQVNVIAKAIPVDPKIIMITPTTLELEKGKVGMVVAITNSADMEVTWSSSNEKIMKVSGTTGSSYSVVEGVSPGTAELKATCGKDTRSIPVTVTKSDTDDESETEKVTKPQLLYVFPSSVVVPVGDTQELSAMTSPWDSTVMWISEDPTIAKVTGNTVQGVTDGETYITAFCGDDSIVIPVSVIGNSSGTSGGVPSTIIPGSVSPSQDKELAGEPEVYLNQDANTFRIINAYTDGSVSVVVQMTSGIRTVATETVTEADGTVKVVTMEKYTTGNTTTTEETIDAYGENTTSVTTIVDAQGNILEKETRIRTTDTETSNVTEIKETETGAGTVYTKTVTKPNQDVETTIEVRNTSGAVTSKTESNTTTVKGTVTEKIRETTNSATTEITRVSDTYGAGEETKTVKTSDATVTTEADRGAYGQYTDLFRTTVTKAGTRREKYSLQTGAAVLKEISGTGGEIVIPDEMETPGGINFSVTKIKNGAMNGISVTKLTLGSGLTRLKTGALKNQFNLKTIVLNGHVNRNLLQKNSLKNVGGKKGWDLSIIVLNRMDKMTLQPQLKKAGVAKARIVTREEADPELEEVPDATIEIGGSVTLRTNKKVVSTVVSDARIAEARAYGKEVVVIGKAVGNVTVAAYNKQGKLVGTWVVRVE